MLKQIVVIISLVQVINCLSIRNNNWLSIDQEYPKRGCSVKVDEENQSLEGKICGYCFAKCQQRLAGCLLQQIAQPQMGSLEYCENKRTTCETTCLNDKRTGRIAEMKWSTVVKILEYFTGSSSSNDVQKH